MTSGFNIAPPGYTPANHPHRGLKPDDSTLKRLHQIAENIAAITTPLNLSTSRKAERDGQR